MNLHNQQRKLISREVVKSEDGKLFEKRTFEKAPGIYDYENMPVTIQAYEHAIAKTMEQLELLQQLKAAAEELSAQ
jgi:hypothetical protein